MMPNTPLAFSALPMEAVGEVMHAARDGAAQRDAVPVEKQHHRQPLRSPAATAGAARGAGGVTSPTPATLTTTTTTTTSGEMRADKMIPDVTGAAPHFAVVHPQGFRILNNASAMERSMRGYFRLPQPPNAATKAEQRRMQRTLRQVEREETQRRARVTGNQDGVVLDGFLILSACEAEDPEEVTEVTLQASQLTSAVQEDLQFFTELKTLDVSDNQLRLGDVLAFPRLETVHLVCNSVTSLADVAHSASPSLSTLVALDLAYNRIPSRDVLHLSACLALRHLDLSNNGLRSLPADLSSLAQLTHLALESNQLATAGVFRALGTLPALTALNLASNRLTHVPLLRLPTAASHTHGARVGEGHEGADAVPFPALRTITLSGNHFSDVASLLPLAALHRTLRHIAVGDNPFLARHPQDATRQLQRALDEAVVDWYFIVKDPRPPTASLLPADGAAEMASGTWKGRTWVRYLPPACPEDASESSEEDVEEDRGGTEPQSRASSLATAAPSPPPPSEPEPEPEGAGEARVGEETSEPQQPQSDHAADDVFHLTVEEYVQRYHIDVQSATQPPPPAKQPKRFFYSPEFRASQRSAEGAAPLVTLPPYEEFMDIYRIAGRQDKTPRRRAPPAVSPRGARAGVTALPVMARSAVPPQPAQPAPPPPPPLAVPPEEPAVIHHIEVVEESSDGEGGGHSREDTREPEDGFFLTGVDSEAAQRRRSGSGRQRRRTSPTTEATTMPTEATPAVSSGGVAADLAAARLSKGNTASPATTNTLPRAPLPRSVVSPANTNVHTAMSELRAMLRKPLPSLPYEPARPRQER